MFAFFKRKQSERSDVPSSKKRDIVFIFTLIFLAAFIGISLVTGIASGTFREMDFRFQFHFSDGAALVALAVAYLIYRIRKGGNDGG